MPNLYQKHNDDEGSDVSPLPSPTSALNSAADDHDYELRQDLRDENARLRLELATLRLEVERLQGGSPTRPQHRPQLSLRQASHRRTRRRPAPPQRVASGEDLEEADGGGEMSPQDLEMHESLRGLHHRRHSRQAAFQLTGRSKYETLSQEEDDENGDVASFDVSDDFDVDITAEPSFCASVQDRAGWLVGLLVLQSMSSFIILRNEELLQTHIVIVQFLTMLVGAGGNAGNQASVRVIRGLAVGTVRDDNLRRFLWNELRMGVTLAAILGLAGCVRAAVFAVPLAETLAITTSLCVIVFISIILGALLPVAMKHVKIDPAHSSTTIQVLMDILGVTITCHMSRAILDSGFHEWLLRKGD